MSGGQEPALAAAVLEHPALTGLLVVVGAAEPVEVGHLCGVGLGPAGAVVCLEAQAAGASSDCALWVAPLQGGGLEGLGAAAEVRDAADVDTLGDNSRTCTPDSSPRCTANAVAGSARNR